MAEEGGRVTKVGKGARTGCSGGARWRIGVRGGGRRRAVGQGGVR